LVGFKINRNFYTNKSNHFTFGLGVGAYRQEAYLRNPFVLSNDLSYSIQSKRNNGYLMELGISSMLAEKAFSNNESPLIGNQNFVVMPLLGYKYISKRFINLRIHTNPVISNQRFYFWGGLSLGLLLRNKNNDKNVSGVLDLLKNESFKKQLFILQHFILRWHSRTNLNFTWQRSGRHFD
jgi:hypothetical protein